MRTFAFVSVLLCLAACKPEPVVVNNLKEAKEAMVIELCREAEALEQANAIADLQKKGWSYAGPLNANGINCQRILFTK
jgi:hypothetical protein